MRDMAVVVASAVGAAVGIVAVYYFGIDEVTGTCSPPPGQAMPECQAMPSAVAILVGAVLGVVLFGVFTLTLVRRLRLTPATSTPTN